MHLSVILPCFNAENTLGVQLEALARQNYVRPWETILVDNGSTDGTDRVARQYASRFENFQIIKALGKKGASHARNQGVKAARGEVLVFCDADDEVGEHYLQGLAEALHEHDLVAARIDRAKFNPFWGGLRFADSQQTEIPKLWYYPFCKHAGGGTLGVKRRAFESVGFFNESLTALEDTDFCIRAHLLGIDLRFAKDAVLHYRLKERYRDIYRQRRGWAEGAMKLVSMYKPSEKNRWQRYLLSQFRIIPKFLRMLPGLSTREERIRYVIQLAKYVGTLQGCWKYRVHPK